MSMPFSGSGIAMSSDGSKMLATANLEIWTSSDSGTTWIQEFRADRLFEKAAMSSDGSRAVAVGQEVLMGRPVPPTTATNTTTATTSTGSTTTFTATTRTETSVTATSTSSTTSTTVTEELETSGSISRGHVLIWPLLFTLPH